MGFHHREIIDGREVFSLRLFYNGIGNQLITHLPDKLIEHSDHTFFYRILDQDLSKINQKKVLQALAQKIRREKEAPFFYYPEYLLADGLLPEHSFRQILELTSHFEINDYVYSLESRSVEFYALSYSWHNWRMYNRRVFRLISSEIKIGEFERHLFGRAKFIYVDCWNKDNKAFFVEKEKQELLILTTSNLQPLMFVFIL